MAEKVRGALFNILGDIEGLTFLDAFAGSGALAFEAASRGAGSVTAIDKDSSAHRIIEQNLKDLYLAKTVKIVKANTAGWSIHNMEKKFDIVLLDPPFDELQTSLLEKLIKRHLGKNGLAVLNYPGNLPAPEFDDTDDDTDIVTSKNYGDTQLVFYRRTK